MQSARVLVVLIREFAARMQTSQDQLDTRDFFLRVLVNGHAAAIVVDLDRAILVDRDFNLLAVTCKCFVDGVIDDLMRQVIRPGRVGIHTRPTPDRFESTEDFDVRSIVSLSHSILSPEYGLLEKCPAAF